MDFVSIPLSLQALYTGHCPGTVHWTLDKNTLIIVEWPRQPAHRPIAKLPIAAVEVATSAGPVIGGARGPVTQPARPIIVILAHWADPVTLVCSPRLRKVTPLPAACHRTHQVVPCVVGRAPWAAPQISWRMLPRRLCLCLLQVRIALQSLCCLPHPSSLAHTLVVLLDVLRCLLFCTVALAPPWHLLALTAWPWDVIPLDTGHSSSSRGGTQRQLKADAPPGHFCPVRDTWCCSTP